MLNGRHRIKVVIGLLVLAAALHAQPQFEASVKQNMQSDAPERISMQPTGFRFTGFHLQTLIRVTYGPDADIQSYDQILGGPSWLASDRFDIVAKVYQRLEAGPDGRRPDVVPVVMKAILEDRFKVRVHREARELPAYTLRLARKDRTLGPGLKVSTITCPTFVPGAPPVPPDPVRWCGFRSGAGVIRAQHVPLAQIAAELTGIPLIGRPVVDRTGLTGNYDLLINIPADESASIFTVLREQTGLMLQSEKASIPVLVVDRAEHPTPD
jgi:uncharacterized protein (TIGR03435 family)